MITNPGDDDFNTFLQSIQNDYKDYCDQQKQLNSNTFRFDPDAEDEDEYDDYDDGEEDKINVVNIKYSHSDIKRLKYQQIKFGIVNNLFHIENVKSGDHLNGMLILLFYYTGFRFGLVKASNKPNTGIGLLSLDTERIKFLDSKVVQFAFRGKSMFPTNIRIFLSQLVYDNLKEF